MARVADLGWQMARASITGNGNAEIELELMEPRSEDEAASSMRIIGRDGLIALRDLIDEVLSDQEIPAPQIE